MLARLDKTTNDRKADFKRGIIAYRAGDYDIALEKWVPLVHNGAVEAQVNLGIMYAKGQGVDRDSGAAFKWYRLAADKGHAKAEYNIGVMFENGKSVEQSYDEAARWYGRAVDHGNPQAHSALGKLHELGYCPSR